MHRTVNQITKKVLAKEFPAVINFNSFLGVTKYYRTLCQRAGLDFNVILIFLSFHYTNVHKIPLNIPNNCLHLADFVMEHKFRILKILQKIKCIYTFLKPEGKQKTCTQH